MASFIHRAMRHLCGCILAAIALCFMLGTQPSTGAPSLLTTLLKNIQTAKFFSSLSLHEQKYLVDLLDASETYRIMEFIDKYGYDSFLNFLDHIPATYEHVLNHYVLQHLIAEEQYYKTHPNATKRPF